MYSKKVGVCLQGTPPPRAPPPPPPSHPNSPAAKFASQGEAHMRTDTQIKFIYYPLFSVCKTSLNTKLCIKI